MTRVAKKEGHDIRIDKEAIWYFQGRVMERQDIVRHLYQYLRIDSTGRYVIETEDDRCHITVDDVPFVIRSVDSGVSQDSGRPCILLSLSDGSREELNLDIPFWHGEENALYCRVKNGAYAARFSRPSYYQLCGFIEYNAAHGIYMITVNDISYPLAFADQP